MKEYKVTVYDDCTVWKNLNGELHRENGPAIEYINGDKYYYKNNKPHRLGGPAVEYSNGAKQYFIEGKKYSEEQFLTTIEKMKRSLVGTTIELDGVEYILN